MSYVDTASLILSARARAIVQKPLGFLITIRSINILQLKVPILCCGRHRSALEESWGWKKNPNIKIQQIRSIHERKKYSFLAQLKYP